MKENSATKTLVIFTLLAVLAFIFVPSEQDLQPNAVPMAESPSGDLVIENVSVRDLDGQIAWQGSVNLSSTLNRIEQGRSDSHRGDGGVFENRERRLPIQSSGYYRKYVIRTPGIRHAGPQRLIVGRNGELWYTHDHYRSFIQVAASNRE